MAPLACPACGASPLIGPIISAAADDAMWRDRIVMVAQECVSCGGRATLTLPVERIP